jgi:hypothetical protein
MFDYGLPEDAIKRDLAKERFNALISMINMIKILEYESIRFLQLPLPLVKGGVIDFRSVQDTINNYMDYPTILQQFIIIIKQTRYRTVKW